MAERFSDPTNINYEEYENQNRFYVWPEPDDFWSYTRLARNWDLLDGLIGGPGSGEQWPPETGAGKGIWAEIQNARNTALNNSVPLGGLMYWYRPSVDVPLSYMTDRGFAYADGRSVLKASHSFGEIDGPIHVPDLRGVFVAGAATDFALGTPGTHNAAPGGVQAEAGNGRIGVSGENQITHRHPIPEHRHNVPGHTHSVAQHTHTVPEHRHVLGGNTGQTNVTGPDTTPSGTVNSVSPWRHSHSLPARTGGAVRGSSGSWSFGSFDTTVGGPTTTGTSSVIATTMHSGAQTENAVHDNRPLNVGLLPFIKVRVV